MGKGQTKEEEVQGTGGEIIPRGRGNREFGSEIAKWEESAKQSSPGGGK